MIDEGPVTAYAEVFTSGQLDPNSTPGNGNGVTAEEDDEAAVVIDALNSSATATVNSNDAIVGNNISSVTMHRLFPVPTVDNLTLELISELEDATETSITIFNAQGQRMLNREVTLNKGFNQVSLNVQALNVGNYFINVISKGEVLTTQRFTKIGF